MVNQSDDKSGRSCMVDQFENYPQKVNGPRHMKVDIFDNVSVVITMNCCVVQLLGVGMSI